MTTPSEQAIKTLEAENKKYEEEHKRESEELKRLEIQTATVKAKLNQIESHQRETGAKLSAMKQEVDQMLKAMKRAA